MIFNTNSNYGSLEAVQESPYEPGIYGALMHVYETECNYNMMMKAVGLSELKYYQETGGDLFVQEAGAAAGFIAKAKALFKSIIEKIKSIFKKFASVINSYVASDKDFVKKYEKELLRKDLKDFEFKGYQFPDKLDDSDAFINTGVNTEGRAVTDVSALASGVSDNDFSDEEMEKKENAIRGSVIKKEEAMDNDEFRAELKNIFYGNDGEKDTLENISIRTQLDIISKASKNISAAEKLQKSTVKRVENFIKELDKAASTVGKVTDNEKADSTGKITSDTNMALKVLNKNISLNKSLANDLTVAFGMQVQALKDRNRQAKAICVKALSYKVKNESASYSESSYNDDLFAGVKII